MIGQKGLGESGGIPPFYTDGLNAIYQACLQLHPIRALGTGFAIETTPGDVHKPTPLPDTAEEVVCTW